MKKYCFIIFFAVLSCTAFCRDNGIVTYKRIVRELSSPAYHGRGYAYDGVIKAGKFIRKEFEKAGADEVVIQPFKIDINTFPAEMEMSVDGRKLKAGKEFVLREYSPGAQGQYKLYYIDTLNYNPSRIFSDLSRPEYKDAFVVCDFWFTYRHKEDFKRLQSKEGCQNGGLIYTWNTPLKFYKAYGEKVVDKPVIWVSKDFPKDASTVSLNIANCFLKDYESSNVIARIKGTRHDSCYVFTAHYDHLGVLGKKVYFPGANDNASGTAGIISLASHFAREKPEFDIWFIAFSGEDANLRGSTYFTSNPLFKLDRIRYLFNLDMIGDNNPVQYCEVSEPGMKGFAALEKINARRKCFKSLNRGKLAANSDHWPFAQKAVPCIMFENEGGDCFKHYHSPEDNWKNAVFTTYPAIFNLVTEFVRMY